MDVITTFLASCLQSFWRHARFDGLTAVLLIVCNCAFLTAWVISNGSWDSLDYMVNRLWVRRYEFRTPAKGKIFFPLPNRPNLLQGLPTPIFNEYKGSFPAIELPRLNVDHTHPPSGKVSNEWSQNSTKPYAFMVWTRKHCIFLFECPQISDSEVVK